MKSAFNIPEDRMNTLLKVINKPAKSSLLLTATNIFAKCCSLVFTPIFTRILTPEEYGAYSLFLSYLSVILVIGTLEISQSAIIRAMQKQRNKLHITLLSGAILTVLASVLASITFIIIGSISGRGELFPYSSLFLILLCVSNGIINLYLAKSRFLYKWLSALLAAIVQSLLVPLFGIVILYFVSEGANHVTAKVATASILTAALALIFITAIAAGAVKEAKLCSMSAREVLAVIKNCGVTLLKLSLPLLPYYLSIMLISQANRHFILEDFGKEAVAVFSVAYSLGISANSVFSGMTGALCPWIMRKIRAGDLEKISKTTSVLIKISGLGIIVIASFFRELLAVIAPSQYSEGLAVAMITALSPLVLSLISLTSAAAVAKEKVLPVLSSGIIASALAISLNILLLPRLGISFCAVVTLVSYIAVFIIQSIGIRRSLGHSIISAFTFIGTFIFTAALLWVIYLLNDLLWARALIFAVFLASLVYLFKKAKWILAERSHSD